ncbi:hypothetical protein KBD68_00980 [Candidatus Woesebacteria bacterium]|nr:hypothetical protein [Candidatus Woesebacteria bacterium]
MKKQMTIIVIAIVVAIVALVPMSIASANDNATPTPAAGYQTGYINQGAPLNLTSATPAPDSIVTPSSSTAPSGFENSSSWAQSTDLPFTVQAFGEAGQDGWSWTNYSFLQITLTQVVTNLVALFNNWTDPSGDGYATISGVVGQTFTFNASGEGQSQIDFFWTTPVPTPTGCPPKTPCTPKVIVIPPQTVECIVPLASGVLSVTYNGKNVGFVNGGWNNIQFTNAGDLMNGLYGLYQANGTWSEESIVVVNLKNGEVIKMQPTPNVDHGYSKGCFIAYSSTWGEGYTPASGHPVASTTSYEPLIIPCPPTEVASEDN